MPRSVGLGCFGLDDARLATVQRLLRVLHEVEHRPEPLTQQARLGDEPLVLRERAPLHLTRLRMRLAEHELGLLARLFLHILRCALRRHEGRAQQSLELAVADEVRLELLDLVCKVGALAPHVLEARDDLREQAVGSAAVVPEQAGAGCHVQDLDWCECHLFSPLVELVEDPVRYQLENDEEDDPDHRGQVERPERREEPPEQPQVGLRHVVEEALDPVQPGRVRQPQPARDDVEQDQERVDADEHGDEVLRLVDRVCKHGESGCQAHRKRVRPRRGFSYAWLKNPPRSSMRARSSAETSTLRGVKRKTLSATRCIPPSIALVRPLPKSMSRFASSWSEPCRLRMTGIPSLKRSAICWASLKLRGSTRWTRTGPGLGTLSTPRSLRGSGAGRRTLVRAFAANSGSVQSSNS